MRAIRTTGLICRRSPETRWETSPGGESRRRTMRHCRRHAEGFGSAPAHNQNEMRACRHRPLSGRRAAVLAARWLPGGSDRHAASFGHAVTIVKLMEAIMQISNDWHNRRESIRDRIWLRQQRCAYGQGAIRRTGKSGRRALDAGISFFDTAFAYGLGKSEENLGRILKDLGANPVISTKIRLEADCVERYQSARPSAPSRPGSNGSTASVSISSSCTRG